MVIILEIKKGDYVTRDSYNNDIVFKVVNIKNGIFYLKGIEERLYADSPMEDLKIYNEDEDKEEEFDVEITSDMVDRSDFFYLPPKIIQLDSDEQYLERCLKFYKKNNILAIGKKINEKNMPEQVMQLLQEYKPDILIITGHDAFYRKKGSMSDLKNYKNSAYFVKTVQVARKYEKSHEKLVIIAGACQSNYEELIKAGANFASSPKRVNIHTLDPAIIASTIALTERNKEIDIVELLEKTKYGKEGMGGLLCNGLMYVGYPR